MLKIIYVGLGIGLCFSSHFAIAQNVEPLVPGIDRHQGEGAADHIKEPSPLAHYHKLATSQGPVFANKDQQLIPGSIEAMLFRIFSAFLDHNSPSGWGKTSDWEPNRQNLELVLVRSLEFIKSQVIRKANKDEMQNEIKALQDEIGVLKQNLARLEAVLAQSKGVRKIIERDAAKRSGTVPGKIN